jgi:hypothetical protein
MINRQKNLIKLYLMIATKLGASAPSIAQLKAQIQYHGLNFLTQILPKEGKILYQALENGRLETSLKKFSKTSLPKLYWEFYSTIFDNQGAILSNPDLRKLQILNQLLNYYSKLVWDSTISDDVVDAEFNSFKEVDALCATVFPYNLKENISIRSYIRQCLPPVPEYVVPRFPTGAVFDHSDHQQRRENLFVTPNTLNLPNWQFMYQNKQHLIDVNGFIVTPQGEVSVNLPIHNDEARYTCVPKTYDSVRGINILPCTVNRFALGYMDVIVKHVNSIPRLRNELGFLDQTVNRDLALAGSIDQSWSTIDLEKASDLVSVDFIKEFFPKEWVEIFMNLRASEISNKEDSFIMNKFSPMGNGVTFILLGIIVYSLIKTASQGERVRVFGDDGLVKHEYFYDSCSILERYGLRVNRGKSFHNGLFRESCGMDCYQGYPITPIRFRKTDLVSQVAHFNLMGELYGDRVVDVARDHLYNDQAIVIPILHKDEPDSSILALYCNFPDEFNKYKVRIRWNDDFQRWEGKFPTLTVRYKRYKNARNLSGWTLLYESLIKDHDSQIFDEHLWNIREFLNTKQIGFNPFDSIASLASNRYATPHPKVEYKWQEIRFLANFSWEKAVKRYTTATKKWPLVAL